MTRREIADKISAYICKLPPVEDMPRRVAVTIEFPNATERHLIFEEKEQ